MIEPAEAECWMCGGKDRPEWVDDIGWPDCARSYGRRSGPKVTYMSKEDADAAAEAMREEYDAPGAYAYMCQWLLSCDSLLTDGCGREFPGTEHYHVTSGH